MKKSIVLWLAVVLSVQSVLLTVSADAHPAAGDDGASGLALTLRRMSLLAIGSLYAQSAVASSVQSGEWLITTNDLGAANYLRADLKFEGDKLSGRAGELTYQGTLSNGRIEFESKRADGSTVTKYSGTLTDGEMKGQATRGSTFLEWSARRIKDKPAAPQTHRFTPTVFHNYFTSTVPPALTIFAGDSVESWSVDAGGVDAQGVRRNPGGNPLTGPFYIEGAMPGDTLVIKFNRIRLTRDAAQSGQRVTPSALTPGYFAQQQPVPNFSSAWTLDRQAGFAQLSKPTDKLKNYKVPLKPMLGCVGVAPPQNQSFRTGYPGTFGGNMDYNQLVEGTTVYLPVYHPGALLFVGDGHAVQGDGELTGDALETSMEWTFTVDLIRGRSVAQPRLENNEYWMASGIANSLPEAVQAATTNLSRWLEEEYKLNAAEIAVILGTALRYEIAELVDPQVHVVAKISKDLLAPIPK
jgi:amidase